MKNWDIRAECDFVTNTVKVKTKGVQDGHMKKIKR